MWTGQVDRWNLLVKGKIIPYMHLFEKEFRSMCFLLTPKRQEPQLNEPDLRFQHEVRTTLRFYFISFSLS